MSQFLNLSRFPDLPPEVVAAFAAQQAALDAARLEASVERAARQHEQAVGAEKDAFITALKALIATLEGQVQDYRRTQFGPAELVAQLRATAGSARRPLGTQPPDPLVDVLVHGQDITRPLGRRRDMPSDRVGPALDHVWTSSFYGARKRFAGLRLVATDLDWSAGDGDREVRGPVGELLLLATGRAAGLDGVGGPGRDEAATRLGA